MVVKARLSIVHELNYDEIQNDHLIQTLVFLEGVELKKNYLLPEKIELTLLFFSESNSRNKYSQKFSPLYPFIFKLIVFGRSFISETVNENTKLQN